MPTNPIILDTDVASLIIKGRLPLTLANKLIGHELVLPFITRGELVKWAHLRNWGTVKKNRLHEWMSAHPLLPGEKRAADMYGHLAASAERRGRPRPLNDMWSAACCLAHDLPIATLNIKDFDYFRIHHGLEIVTA